MNANFVQTVPLAPRRPGRLGSILKKKADEFNGATGALVRLVKNAPERGELLRLLRIGVQFARRQHAGSSPGYLRRYITEIASRLKPCTFEGLLEELELAAVQRAQAANNKNLPPIESVDRLWGLVKYHHPKRGRLDATFGNLRNILTKAKKANSQLPATGESD